MCVDLASHYSTLDQLVLEPNYFPTMECRRARGGKHPTIGDVYERNEVAQYEKLEACLQQKKEWLNQFGNQLEQFSDRFDMLTDQIATLVVANKHRRQPNLRFMEEDDYDSIGGEPINVCRAWSNEGESLGAKKKKCQNMGGQFQTRHIEV